MEIFFGIGVGAGVETHHAQVVVGDRPAMVVSALLVCLEGALIPGERLFEVSLDVREDAEVLFGPCAKLAGRSAEADGLEEGPAGFFERARRQVETTDGVERLGGENVTAELAGDLIALPAQLPGPSGLIALMEHHGQPP